MIIFYTTLFLSNNLGLLLHKVIAVTPITLGRTGLILFGGGGGGGGGHSISLPDCFAYTVHKCNFVWDFIRAFFKDFPVEGGFFEKGTFLWDNILVGDCHMADIPRMNP